MDPNVQVALVSVIATMITTIGVVVVAVINNRKERGNAASAGVEAGLEESVVLERMFSLVEENSRKETTIKELREQNTKLRSDNNALRAQLRKKEQNL